MAALQKPIVLSTLATILGTRKDVGAVCTSGNINKWAKYKPVRFNSVAELTPAQRALANYGIGIPASLGYNSLANMVNAVVSGAADWQYLQPRGVTYNEWYRMLDFVGYEGGARSPMYNIGNSSSYCDGSSEDRSFGFGRVLPNSQYELSLNDLKAGTEAVTFDEWYFGIACYDEASPSRCYATTSNVKYKDMISTTIEEVGLSVKSVSTPSSGTRRYIAFPFFSSIPFTSWSSSFIGTMFPVSFAKMYHDYTYISHYTTAFCVGYFLGTDQSNFKWQYRVSSNQYTKLNVIVQILRSNGTVNITLFSDEVTLINGTYLSPVQTKQDSLLWNFENAKQVLIEARAGGVLLARNTFNIVHNADPTDPPTP